jgi:hypothetical protein
MSEPRINTPPVALPRETPVGTVELELPTASMMVLKIRFGVEAVELVEIPDTDVATLFAALTETRLCSMSIPAPVNPFTLSMPLVVSEIVESRMTTGLFVELKMPLAWALALPLTTMEIVTVLISKAHGQTALRRVGHRRQAVQLVVRAVRRQPYYIIRAIEILVLDLVDQR